MRAVHLLIVLLAAFVSNAVSAHELSMAEMEVRETSPGEFLWQWTASSDKAAATVLTPVWPESCVAETNMLRCGEQGLFGTLTVQGVGEDYSAAIVKIFWLDGQSRIFTLTAGQPEVHLYGSAEDRRGMGEIARAYSILGIEHILGGFDHLMFVLSLLFLVNFNKRLVLTISAFTLAHSLTLALSALGLLTLRSPPVEATIALSIMLVAGEALNKEQTLSRRWPALVAFLFGLVHGLGFAGALAEIGLPQKHLFVALLTFNVGVELGQLLVVVICYGVYRLFAARPQFVAARKPALYAIGGIAAYWSIGRIVSILV
ncbi:MAG TPA: HupE/UreJ family protein [Steroidobacter sp.]|uniref:HupE/UreJ family protein n=1 Tax=Steroidobacter sp. TaxID=1978227 RepID=UPI002EDB3B25